MSIDLAGILEQHINRANYSLGQLARLADLPKRTLANWVEGRVKKPRHHIDVLKLASALQLTETDTNQLLAAAGYHGSVASLRHFAAKKGDETWLKLLSTWPEVIPQEKTPPFQAIRDLPYFIGREKEIEAIKSSLQTKHLSCLHGMGGVGKTSLAAHLAYQLRPFFADGVLWARVDTSDPMAILATFAGAYKHDVSQYNDLPSRSRMVRQILAHKDVLIVLDNVQSDAHLEPLLPPSGECAVMVTTRHTSLVTLLGARWFHIQPFDPQLGESLALFAHILGEERVTAEASTLADIAHLLGHLPLAISLIAGRIAQTHTLTTVDFYERLQTSEKLPALTYGQVSLAATFATTYRLLSANEQQLFTLLGTFGGEDFDPVAVVAMEGQPAATIKTMLTTFYGLSLLQEGRPDRFRLHPLVRDFAQAQMATPDQMMKMVSYFCQFAMTHQRDFARLDAEYSNIFYALETALRYQVEELYITAVNALYQYLDTRGLYDLSEKHLTQALKISTERHYTQHHARTLLKLSLLQLRHSAFALAVENLTEGLHLAHQIEDARLIGRYLNNRGRAYRELGEWEQALADMQAAATIARGSDDKWLLVTTLASLADIFIVSGEFEQAQQCLEESLPLARVLDQQASLTDVLTFLGILAARQGKIKEAVQYWEEDLQRARVAKHRVYIARALLNLATLDHWRGLYVQAQARFQESLDLARQLNHQLLIIGNLLDMGQLTYKQGYSLKAFAQLQEALNLSHQLQNDFWSAQIHHAFSRLYDQEGQLAKAITHIEKAAAMARQFGIREILITILADYGRLAAKQNDKGQADAYLAESEAMAQEEGDIRLFSYVLLCSGQRYIKQGKAEKAILVLQQALTLAEQCDLQENKAMILWTQARTLAADNPAQASQLARQSLALFRRFGDYRAETVAAWLDSTRL